MEKQAFKDLIESIKSLGAVLSALAIPVAIIWHFAVKDKNDEITRSQVELTNKQIELINIQYEKLRIDLNKTQTDVKLLELKLELMETEKIK